MRFHIKSLSAYQLVVPRTTLLVRIAALVSLGAIVSSQICPNNYIIPTIDEDNQCQSYLNEYTQEVEHQTATNSSHEGDTFDLIQKLDKERCSFIIQW